MMHRQLRDGRLIPQLGLGTWQLTGEQCRTTVSDAIRMGYRHIDTAFAYGNHTEVAAGIADGGVPRDKLFVTTKIPLGKQSRSQVLELGSAIRKELVTDYVDLLLIHWPNRDVPFEETFAALHELMERGVARSIGISNFNAELVKRADGASPAPIVTNQVEFHPFLYQKRLLETCEALDIRLTAYSPLARGEALRDERLIEIGRAHDATGAQVSLAWLLAKGLIVIPKASSREHLESNLASTDIRLSTAEIERIDSFGDHRRQVDGPWKHFPLD
jgi:2,5-diketo-D-gluconate reductase B